MCTKTIAKLMISMALICGAAYAQELNNPNKLPPCPEPDYSKAVELGKNSRTAKWKNCWGRFTLEQEGDARGSVFEGEWSGGWLNGKGSFSLYLGNYYFGEIKNNRPNGRGIYIDSSGRRKEGIWDYGNFVREEKVNLVSEKEKQHGFNYEIFAIEPQFDWVSPFKQGLAAVRIGDHRSGKYGFIDKLGQMVIQPIFSSAYSFEEGLAAVKIGDGPAEKWGFIDKQGIFVIGPKFYNAHGFREGLAAVHISSDKIGFIDKHGNFVINPVFDYTHTRFFEGLVGFQTGAPGERKWGFIDRQGKIVIKAQFDSAMPFRDGLAPVRIGSPNDGKWGFSDQLGNIVIRAQYDAVSFFIDGLASVRIGTGNSQKEGVIDKKNNFVVQPAFSVVNPFYDGLAFVRAGDDETGKWGVIDKAGRLLVIPQFDIEGVAAVSGTAFIEGVAAVSVGKGVASKSGYIDKSGKFLFPPQFDNHTDLRFDFVFHGFSEGFAANCVIVNSQRKCGFISKDSIQIAQANKAPQNEQLITSTKKPTKPLVLSVSSTQPDPDGLIVITVQTNADTSSLKINGEEQGGRADGNYSIKKVARVGQNTLFTITAVDINGNSDTKTITVARLATPAADTSIALKPEAIKRVPTRDAVAIIIGIQNYKRVPKAEFANNDAREFNEYAIRALGIRPEKIKMLVDEEADEVNIVKAFENWLPIQVNKDKTDVYVFYSGHGLPAPDGKSLYFLPHGVDKELLSRTAVGQNEIVAALSSAKPKSVTMFIDACYSGQTRGGDVLVANAKPLSLKSDTNAYPPNFTVITASANDQISSSSPELKHGIFSFYLMKGMEGEADANKDGKITVGEMQDYLSDKVSRQAMTLNRKQTTQLVGDAGGVLVGR